LLFVFRDKHITCWIRFFEKEAVLLGGYCVKVLVTKSFAMLRVASRVRVRVRIFLVTKYCDTPKFSIALPREYKEMKSRLLGL